MILARHVFSIPPWVWTHVGMLLHEMGSARFERDIAQVRHLQTIVARMMVNKDISPGTATTLLDWLTEDSVERVRFDALAEAAEEDADEGIDLDDYLPASL